MPLYSPTHSALAWNRVNLLTEALLKRSSDRYLRLRYEDLVDRPRETVERILALVQEEAPQVPFVAERSVKLEPTHTVTGNPGVYKKTGVLKLQLDEEWRAKMKRSDRNIVTALTIPLLFRYGYLNWAPK